MLGFTFALIGVIQLANAFDYDFDLEPAVNNNDLALSFNEMG